MSQAFLMNAVNATYFLAAFLFIMGLKRMS